MRKLSMKEVAKKRKKKGFTLVELIIVIAIIAILAAMAIPKFSAVRTEGKVSNDVAAAKNIQTTVAMLLAEDNATYKTGISGHAVAVKDDVATKLDGKLSKTCKTEATNGDFTVTVADNGDITVYADGSELYPDVDGTGKAAYLTKAKAAKATS